MVPVSSSYRRTVFTTHSCYRPWCLQHLFLYLCNKFATHCVSKSINPFIEGQPLQQELGKSLSDWSREKFQSIYRGTAFATSLSIRNGDMEKGRFNPSIEGQPLQQGVYVYHLRPILGVSIPLSRDSLCNHIYQLLCICSMVCFNPSIEGQPLQPLKHASPYSHIRMFQSLYRGTAFATQSDSEQCSWSSLVSIPLSRDSLCNCRKDGQTQSKE